MSVAPSFEATKGASASDTFSSTTPRKDNFLGLQLWFAFSILLIGIAALAARTSRPSYALTAFGDLTQLFLVGSAAGVMFANGLASRGRVRVFWLFMSLGFAIWFSSLSLWAYFEVWLRRPVPDLPAGDVLLYLKIVPMISAIAVAPHLEGSSRPRMLGYLDLFLLVAYWLYIYVFWVLCYRIAVNDQGLYNFHFNVIDAAGNQIFLVVLGLSALRTHGPWRILYMHYFGAAALYTVASMLSNVAIDLNKYYTGSVYDLPLIAALAWFAFLGFVGWKLSPAVPAPPLSPAERASIVSRKIVFWPGRLAMCATLSTPVIGAYLLFSKERLDAIHHFRILTTLFTMLFMLILLFLKQDLLHVDLMRSLDEVSRAYANLGRFTDRLIQSEKLASLGKLVADVAHEIEKATAVILDYSARITSMPNADEGARNMVGKIGQNASRTGLLVQKMLGFARETPLENAPVAVVPLLDSALKLSRVSSRANISADLKDLGDSPEVTGDAHQLLQVFLHIIANALDAMEDATSGVLSITTRSKDAKVEIEFADTGAGLKDPERVFDPFYTTKPVGKGTGLGLSTCYGIVHQHGGEILCRNRPAGGAAFTVILPAVREGAEAPSI
ncbi:MAG: sensor histidine kinase [Candidatus Acidiferrales bacterium]